MDTSHLHFAGEVANFVPGVHKDKINLVDDQQFLYNGSRHTGNKAVRKPEDVGRFYWRCVERNRGCPATAFTELKEGDGEVERFVRKGGARQTGRSQRATVE